MNPREDVDVSVVNPEWVEEIADAFMSGQGVSDLSTANFPLLAAAAGVGSDDIALHRWVVAAAEGLVPDAATLSRPERMRVRGRLRAALAWLWADPYMLTAQKWDAVQPPKPPLDGPRARKTWARANQQYAERQAEDAAFGNPNGPIFIPSEYKAGETSLDAYRDALIVAIAAALGQTVSLPPQWKERRGRAGLLPEAPELALAEDDGDGAREEALPGVLAPVDVSAERAGRERGANRRRPWIMAVGAIAVATLVGGVLLATAPQTQAPAADGIGEPAAMPPLDVASQQVSEPGWWPERVTSSVASPPAEPTLNSFVDNESHGFEPNFMQVKLQDAQDSAYTDQLLVRPGDVLTTFVYFNNDAEESAAENTRLRIVMPGVITGSTNAYAVLSADNAVVPEVQDGVSILVADAAGEEVALRYVENSAIVHSAGAVDGQALEDALFDGGVLLGCDALDGTLAGGGACSGYVTFDIRVDQPGFEVAVKAKPAGSSTDGSEVVQLDGESEIDVLASYQNTGSNQQDNVVMRLGELPAGISYVADSTQIANSTTNGTLKPTIEGLATTGLNLGSYQPRGNVFVKFRLRVSDLALTSAEHGQLDLRSVIRVTTNAGYKESGVTLATTTEATAAATATLEQQDPEGFWRAGWGPQRELVTTSELSPYPVFNSVEDDPTVGDERDFVGVARDTGAAADPETQPTWYNDVWVEAGETYVMRVDVHNGGSLENEFVPAGSLQNARLRVGITEGDGVSSVFGLLSADNALSVWDGVTFHHDKGTQVAFDAATADQYIFGASDDGIESGPMLQKLGAQAFSSEGSLLGRKLDGIIPPGTGSAEAIYFKIRVLSGAPAPAADDGVLWGPIDRATFAIASGGAPYPVFNAITDNPNYGDERNFLTTKSSRHLSAGGWIDDVWINPGETFFLRVFGNNSGQDSAGSVPAGLLHNARLRLSIHDGDGVGEQIIKAELLAANADPIWDSVIIHSEKSARLQFDTASFKINNEVHAGDGVRLDGDPFSEQGALLGYEDQDGVLPPGYQFDFFVFGSFTVAAE